MPTMRRLRQRGVETPLLAEGFGQSLGHPEHAAELGDVLAEHQHPLVGGHRVVQCPVDRLRHGQRRRRRHGGQQRPCGSGASSPCIGGRSMICVMSRLLRQLGQQLLALARQVRG